MKLGKPEIWIGSLVATALIGVAIAWSFRGSPIGEGQRLRPAAQFSLPDPSGTLRSLEEFRGQTVLVHFWASWCPPCVDEMPKLVRLARRLEGRKFRLIAISLDDAWKSAYRILPQTGLPSDLTPLLDLSRAVSAEYGSDQLPESYVLNPNLEVVAKLVGAQEWEGRSLREAIERLLSVDPSAKTAVVSAERSEGR